MQIARSVGERLELRYGASRNVDMAYVRAAGETGGLPSRLGTSRKVHIR